MKKLKEIVVDKKDLEIERLKKEIEELKHKEYLKSWETNPDRSGGAFTKEEIANATAWK